MIIKIKRKYLKYFSYSLAYSIVLSLFFFGLTFVTPEVFAGNTTNETVIARVNVSNTEPDLYLVVIEDPLDSFGQVDLEAGNSTTVICNGSFQDANGFDDITTVNATLYRDNVASDAANDNNTHYTNISCGTCTEITGSNGENGSCLCQFAVEYYADPGNWICNMTITDQGFLEDSENTTLTFFNEILGIDVGSSLMDYGNMSVTQISDPFYQTVTNIGNVAMNVTVRSFGGTDETIGDNVTMICEAGANITFENHRYDYLNDSFEDMYNLSNMTTQIGNLTIPVRQDDTALANSSNITFWRLRIPAGASGICNGTIIFGAYDAVNN